MTISLRPTHVILLAIVGSLLPLACSDAGKGFSVVETEKGVTVMRDGALVTEYIIGDANKPYLWPIIGPTGKKMTRAYPMEDVEGERQDHPHHRSVWFAHQEVGGVDTWLEPLSMEGRKFKEPGDKEKALAGLGSTLHREFRKVTADGDKAVIVTANDYLANDGTKLMEDERRLTFRAESDRLILDFDVDLVAIKDIDLGETKDAGLSVRVAHSMCVDAGEGGKIVNSHGDEDKEAWGKRARWCSFYGPVEGETLGVSILNHPSSFRHPTAWHARTYGLFTVNAFMDPGGEDSAEEVVAFKKGEVIKLRHRIIFHKGGAVEAKINEAWKEYAASE